MEAYYRIVVWVLGGILGLCVGSFLNVVIYRLPAHMNLAKPASHCPKCGAAIKWYDNIPVLSWLLLRGKCRHCKEKISPRYMLVELLNAALWLLCIGRFWEKNPYYALLCMAVCSVFICVAFIDLEHKIIFDRFQLLLAGLGILSLIVTPGKIPAEDMPAHLMEHLIGGVGGFLSFWLIGLLVGKLTEKEALGGGDVKLAGMVGLILGWKKLLLGVLLASVWMLVFVAAFRRKRGLDKNREYPFAPFLTLGFTVALLFGDAIIDAYLLLVFLI